MYIQYTVVVNSQAQYYANQGKLTLSFKRGRIKPKQFCRLIICEHPCLKKKIKKLNNYGYNSINMAHKTYNSKPIYTRL